MPSIRSGTASTTTRATRRTIFGNPKINDFVWINQLVLVAPEPLFGGAAHLGLNLLWATIIAFDTDFSSASPAPGFQLTDNGVGSGDLATGLFLQFKPMFAGGRPVFVPPGGVRRHRADRIVRSAQGHQPERQLRVAGALLGGHRPTGASPGNLGALQLPVQLHHPPAGESVSGGSPGRQRQGRAGVLDQLRRIVRGCGPPAPRRQRVLFQAADPGSLHVRRRDERRRSVELRARGSGTGER